MRLRYKILIAFLIIIVIATPIPLYIIHNQIQQQKEHLINEGTIYSMQLAHSIAAIVLLNSGNVAQTSIDALEFIETLKPLSIKGLASIQVILAAPNEKYNGLLLVDIPNNKTLTKLPDIIVNKLKSTSTYSYISSNNIRYFEFVAQSPVAMGNIHCIARLLYNEDAVLKPVYRNYTIFVISTVIIIFLAVIFSLSFTRAFSRPIETMIQSIKQFDEGVPNIEIPIKNKTDEIRKLATTIQHLFYMVNLEIRALQQTNRELLRLDKLKDDFLANLSYELKIPLNGIIHLTNNVINDYTEKSHPYTINTLQLITNSAMRLSYLIDDISDFTRLKNNDIVLNKKIVDITGVINFVISLLQPTIATKDIKIILSIQNNASRLYVDEQRLQQIFLNIIGNSIKYTKQGTITIATQMHDSNTLSIILTSTAGGIPQELVKNIDDFGYDSNISSKQSGGSALGLAVTTKLIELHGGSIYIEPQPHGGSCVTVDFPYDENLMGKELSTASTNDFSISLPEDTIQYQPSLMLNTSQGFVYIVDDDPVNVKILQEMLQNANFYIEFFHDPSLLYDSIQKNRIPDIVLLDTILPGTSAFQVCETIRKSYSLHELPIIIMTSKHRAQEIITSFRVGANDYLSKPYNEEELIARIHNLIMLKRSVKEHNDYLILKHEIRLAHEIHNSVVIQNIPPLHNITIAHAYIPTRDMGGDFYDVIKIDDDTIGIMIADVTGHGIPAALVCAMLKMAFINNKEHAQYPARMLTLLNKDLSSTIHDNYITSAYSLINTKHKTITVSIAGHLPPLLLHNNGKVFKNWTRAFPIGWIEDAEYQETSIHYQHGDKFILYTDGVIELKKGNQIFGEDNLITFIANSFGKQPAILIEEMIKLLHDWSSIPADEPFKDDVTLLIAELL